MHVWQSGKSWSILNLEKGYFGGYVNSVEIFEKPIRGIRREITKYGIALAVVGLLVTVLSHFEFVSFWWFCYFMLTFFVVTVPREVERKGLAAIYASLSIAPVLILLVQLAGDTRPISLLSISLVGVLVGSTSWIHTRLLFGRLLESGDIYYLVILQESKTLDWMAKADKRGHLKPGSLEKETEKVARMRAALSRRLGSESSDLRP